MRKVLLKALIVLAVSLAVATPQWARANAITVLGNSDAHDCFLNASTRSSAADSLESCKQALRTGELSTRDHAATLVNMGIILNALARMDEAMKVFNDALARSPNLPEAVLSRGNSHFLRKDYDLAIADYERSLEYGVKDPAAAHFNHGMAHGKKKNFKQAAHSYLRALELNPDFRRAQARLDRLDKMGLSKQAAPRPKPPTTRQ
ncbi:MAG: tetratricopeptide repeat protein [Candidatus Binatia bacterium]|nr:tetratricopeptide repeat protein [Candidatus Binatia bacterium]